MSDKFENYRLEAGIQYRRQPKTLLIIELCLTILLSFVYFTKALLTCSRLTSKISTKGMQRNSTAYLCSRIPSQNRSVEGMALRDAFKNIPKLATAALDVRVRANS